MRAEKTIAIVSTASVTMGATIVRTGRSANAFGFVSRRTVEAPKCARLATSTITGMALAGMSPTARAPEPYRPDHLDGVRRAAEERDAGVRHRIYQGAGL